MEFTSEARAELDPARRLASGDGVLRLDIEDLLELLPHRGTQLFVDRVLALVPGLHAVGLKNVTGNEAGLAKRKHGFIFPAPFALEFLVQLATVVRHYPQRFARREDSGQKGRSPLGDPLPIDTMSTLRGIRSLEVKREMVVGDQLYGAVSILGEQKDEDGVSVVSCAGQVHLAGEPYIEAAFDLVPLSEILDYSREWRPVSEY